MSSVFIQRLRVWVVFTAAFSSMWGEAYAYSQQLYFYLTDHLGSTRLVTDESGIEQARYAYYPYGELFAPPPRGEGGGEGEVSYLYTGQELDRATELYDYGARYYEPAVGRFLSRDPILAEPPYAYARNNPHLYVDPTGEGVIVAFPEELSKRLVKNYEVASENLKIAIENYNENPSRGKAWRLIWAAFVWWGAYSDVNGIWLLDLGIPLNMKVKPFGSGGGASSFASKSEKWVADIGFGYCPVCSAGKEGVNVVAVDASDAVLSAALKAENVFYMKGMSGQALKAGRFNLVFIGRPGPIMRTEEEMAEQISRYGHLLGNPFYDAENLVRGALHLPKPGGKIIVSYDDSITIAGVRTLQEYAEKHGWEALTQSEIFETLREYEGPLIEGWGLNYNYIGYRVPE